MMMLPSLQQRTAERYMTNLNAHGLPGLANRPEENDETVSDDSLPSTHSDPYASPQSHSPLSSLTGMAEVGPCRAADAPRRLGPCQQQDSLPSGYDQLTPFPSQAGDPHMGHWYQPSFTSSGCCSGGGYPNSLASCPPSGEYLSYYRQDCYPVSGHSPYSFTPGRHSPSLSCLEPPQSLRSVPPPLAGHGPFLTPYPCWPGGAGCCQQCPNDRYGMAAAPHHSPRAGYPLPCHPPGLAGCTRPGTNSTQSAYTPTDPRKRSVTSSSPLPLEQRKVFVTYEADSDKHVHEIIQFVALLRRNGFDTRIDVFEQQFKSISKIDFMEKYISEKDYLIIIVISPKYYETVTHSHISMENDENTLNTVYIHKQLQNEFIQNGSKNFRFIPILFPGARKCHVPTWLQNTHIYWWPKDRDDILRRLMRVEKYNPPPIGELPTIVSIPI
ncbi:uncharacterized protein traf3ip2l isoform X1 [Lepisosteus oculatus]|uniref:uncharacterized protein traf3ip2l isoform X1 n=1 Tax=Lepisosteus oculatus TaxID=7918 RepID=UPI0007403186|nr:PREDICTED: uncharacterized protein LOC102691757 isoform X1 [Lepisosteus oculatus]